MLTDASGDIIDEWGRTLNVMNGRPAKRTSNDEQMKINN